MSQPIEPTEPAPRIVDTNVYLGRWPTRRLPADETPKLVALLKQNGVAEAWAGSFEALLHRDLAGVNQRLAAECREHGAGLLRAFGAVNPLAPDWEEDLRRCHEVHAMPGIRLHPNYHDYRLDDPAFARLLAAAAERSLVVQIAARMEDPRTQSRLLAADDVDLAPLVELLPKVPQPDSADKPGLRLELLNALGPVRPDLIDRLIAAGPVYVEFAMLEGVAGLAQRLTHVPPDRILFGSHAAFFAWQSAALKLRESALSGAQIESLEFKNARQVLPGT
ncbi:MAG: amidohydrolase [Pirellulaceae bacterium]|nr:amidohydrolase [Pirellulaceae bacterium]